MIDARDCRIDAFRGYDKIYWSRAIHLPTGIEVKGNTEISAVDLMRKLDAAVTNADNPHPR